MNGAIDALLAPDVRPFVIAGAIMIVLAGIEMLTSVIGFSISHVVGKDFDFDGHSGAGLASVMVWINAGRVPLLILIFLLLGVFSIEGFFLQAIAHGIGAPMPTWIASLLALAGTPSVVRLAGRAIARAIPRDETYAINEEDLVGRVGVVTIGPLDHGLPGRVRLKDAFGNWHSAAARASSDSKELGIGTSVLLVARDEKGFVAIAAPAELLES
jgi:membrane protein implicated in regulation of membrane protease activity